MFRNFFLLSFFEHEFVLNVGVKFNPGWVSFCLLHVNTVTGKLDERLKWIQPGVSFTQGEVSCVTYPTKVIQQTFLPLSFYLKKPTTTTASTKKGNKSDLYINPFVPNAPLLHPLKTSENRKVFWCFQGVEKGCIENGLGAISQSV